MKAAEAAARIRRAIADRQAAVAASLAAAKALIDAEREKSAANALHDRMEAAMALACAECERKALTDADKAALRLSTTAATDATRLAQRQFNELAAASEADRPAMLARHEEERDEAASRNAEAAHAAQELQASASERRELDLQTRLKSIKADFDSESGELLDQLQVERRRQADVLKDRMAKRQRRRQQLLVEKQRKEMAAARSDADKVRTGDGVLVGRVRVCLMFVCVSGGLGETSRARVGDAEAVLQR